MTDRLPFDKYKKDVHIIMAIAFQQEQLERPDNHCIDDDFWKLMCSCWSFDVCKRPNTSEILVAIDGHDCTHKKSRYILIERKNQTVSKVIFITSPCLPRGISTLSTSVV